MESVNYPETPEPILLFINQEGKLPDKLLKLPKEHREYLEYNFLT